MLNRKGKKDDDDHLVFFLVQYNIQCRMEFHVSQCVVLLVKAWYACEKVKVEKNECIMFIHK